MISRSVRGRKDAVLPASAVPDVRKSTPEAPALPKDLEFEAVWTERGAAFRTSADCTGYGGCRANKIALINAVDDEQWPYLYHYGFVPIRTSYGRYRIHWRHGNNVSNFPRGWGRADKGLCCYVPELTHCVDGNVLMQLLVLRTKPRSFVMTACRTSPAERTLENRHRYTVLHQPTELILTDF